jgi:predicted nucleic-acid-binding Zn-ribbon protein
MSSAETIEYHNYDKCIKCQGNNDIKITDTLDSWLIMEAETKCQKCGHKNYWAHGYYQSFEEENFLKEYNAQWGKI